ncbi:enoyl-CoA hydratase [Mycobacterium sp. M1]|uniref:Enoyl-CoA hydratase n=1 Tax=Mycolicibacter acidiphilus TaxID=2835306 RepID=A0ABS5RK54_9MYCO|nr:enoyl-CoA hydratase [Mycolicibacter acidiphilus]MBS9533994.1 enoyl-CoA hydratase [Mycolicibacter acidiphilus]
MSEFVGVHLDAAHPRVATLALSRPPNNALTRQFCREIVAAADEVSRRDDVATVIVYGGHEMFCAGDDDAELRTLAADEVETFTRARHAAIEAVAGIAKPTVAAVTGYALGSGLALALAADWLVSGDNVRFGVTEILSGRIPDAGSLARLTATVGAGRAKELAYSGRFVDAEEAQALGLIDAMVGPDGVYEAALAWAARFTDTAPAALAAVKAVIDGAPARR